MPPKKAANPARGRPKGSKSKQSSASAAPPESSNPFESSDDQAEGNTLGEPELEVEENAGAEKSIPEDLLTRVLHELFAKAATRISRDANAAVGKYVDVFVREAIARAAVDKRGGFLEVEDLEKIAPQLLLDL
ncbi:CENP-S associating centromere protein X domain-containing protein [Hirsutella rhossiliensis]|uniref:CENP-S associating centromere protein X domain-containing protein n=1 Tax=Hirsutella rhossiliensis TaxID=111463 RepID=A0A9P8SHB5_9HYPO|nr:CENP-S associating centromere protein X domain-containing protein [Hirsutella rhossiliensis]KAH0960846.1 CENP-S associating centromere protein X domain-containing protein [Hirsutella rhossiliensis]